MKASTQTIEHLSALGYKDGDKLFFRALKKIEKKKTDARNIHSVFPNIPQALQDLNSEGFSIYVVVNGGGDTDEDVIEGKAVFYEHDDRDKEAQLYLWQSLNLPEPTFQIDTGGKSIHSYWVFDSPLDIKLWKSLQTDLLNYSDGDRQIKNESRVMRLAGFKHTSKGNTSEIISRNGTQYSYETIRSIVPLPQPQPQRNSKPSKAEPRAKLNKSSNTSEIPIERLLTAAHRAILSGVSQGGRNNTGASLARDLIGVAAMGSIECDYIGKDYTLQIDGDTEQLFNNFCDGCNPPLSHQEGEDIWRSAQGNSDGEPCIQSYEVLQNCARAYLKETLPKRGRPAVEKSKSEKDYQAIGRKIGLNIPDKDIDSDSGEPKSKLVKLQLDLLDMFGKRLEYNEMSREIEIDRASIDLNLAKTFCSNHLFYDSSTENCIIALNSIAIKFKYHPVKEYLESLRGKTTNLDMITHFPKRYFGNSDELQNRLFFRKLVATVARVMKPGAKDDSLLVLQGKQGAGKSTALKALAGDDWFNDDLRSLDDKDEIAKLSRFWLLELAEVDYLFGKKEVELFKRFLSCTEDTFRPPYGRANILVKRSCSLFATTNKSEFLADPTGDRRYWVVEVKNDIDIEGIRCDRDTIWATALAAYESGDIHYLDPIEQAQHNTANIQWRDEDPWAETILPKLGGVLKKVGSIEYVNIQEIMDSVLEIPIDRQDKRQRNRIGHTLQAQGFERMTRTIDGKPKKIWGREILVANPSNPTKKDGLDAENLSEYILSSSNLSNPSFKTTEIKDIKKQQKESIPEKKDDYLIKTAVMAKDVADGLDELADTSTPDGVSNTSANPSANPSPKDGLASKDGLANDSLFSSQLGKTNNSTYTAEANDDEF